MSDLTNCAHEPIHIPGAIQPHGCLLTLDSDRLTVSQVSANVESFLGIAPQALLGRSLREVLPGESGDLLARALQAANLDDVNPLVVATGLGQFDAVLHRGNGELILELEARDVPQRQLDREGLEQALTRLARCDELGDLLDTTTRVVRDLTGFDRVLVYRFDPHGHGEVVSEIRRDDMEPFLGLRFPESDIPRQARELYLRTWSRSIVDARYRPVPLVPALRPETGAPLDLTAAHLRSVSPVHLEYLANMGVQASMSVSLIVAGRLWGLISGGHRTPHRLDYRLRRACETIGRVVSLEIGAIDALDFRRRQEEKALSLARLVDGIQRRQGGQVLDGVDTEPSALLALTSATGTGVVIGDRAIAIGSCPPASTLIELSRWLHERDPIDGLFETASLGAEDARWAPCADVASGVLAVVLPSATRQCVLWFRPEIARTVHWGGNPHEAKTIERTGGSLQLHPRHSFALWRDVVTGQAQRWDRADRDAAESFRRRAVELDLGRQIDKEREAVRARDDLVAVVSHDLRTPMSVVVMQAAIIQRMIIGDADGVLQRFRTAALTIQRAGQQMGALLHDLLDLSKIQAGRFTVTTAPCPASRLVVEAVEMMDGVAAEANVTLVTDGLVDDPVQADAERIFQVFSNLIGNAIKYAGQGRRVRIGVARSDSVCEFRVADSGPGIAPEQIEFLFQRFWQGKRDDTSGIGLGLYIARGIVQAHGGTIRAESAAGEGTTMIFTLPLAQADAGALERDPPSPAK